MHLLSIQSELEFWQQKWQQSGGQGFAKVHMLKKIMLSMAQEEDDLFLKDKIVADFGCGPRGSLAWVKSTPIKIGIDILVDQ
jgi:hypothetical protein